MKLLYLLSSILLFLGNITFFLFAELKFAIFILIIISYLVGIIFAYILYRYLHDRRWQEVYFYITSKGRRPIKSVGLWILNRWPSLVVFGHAPNRVKRSARLIYSYDFKISLTAFLLTITTVYFINKPDIGWLLLVFIFFVNVMGVHLGINSYFLNVFIRNLPENRQDANTVKKA